MTNERLEQIRKQNESRDILTVEEVSELRAEIDRLRADLDSEMELTKQAMEKLHKKPTHAIAHCEHCGWESERIPKEEAMQLIAEHVATCDKHPIAAVRAERDKLKDTVKDIHLIATQKNRDNPSFGYECIVRQCELAGVWE